MDDPGRSRGVGAAPPQARKKKRVDQQRVDLGVDVLDGDLEAVEAPGLGPLHLGREVLREVLVDDAVRGGEEGQDRRDEVALLVVQLLLPVLRALGARRRRGSPGVVGAERPWIVAASADRPWTDGRSGAPRGRSGAPSDYPAPLGLSGAPRTIRCLGRSGAPRTIRCPSDSPVPLGQSGAPRTIRCSPRTIRCPSDDPVCPTDDPVSRTIWCPSDDPVPLRRSGAPSDYSVPLGRSGLSDDLVPLGRSGAPRTIRCPSDDPARSRGVEAARFRRPRRRKNLVVVREVDLLRRPERGLGLLVPEGSRRRRGYDVDYPQGAPF